MVFLYKLSVSPERLSRDCIKENLYIFHFKFDLNMLYFFPSKVTVIVVYLKPKT